MHLPPFVKLAAHFRCVKKLKDEISIHPINGSNDNKLIRAIGSVDWPIDFSMVRLSCGLAPLARRAGTGDKQQPPSGSVLLTSVHYGETIKIPAGNAGAQLAV